MVRERKPNRGPGAAIENRAAIVNAAREVFSVRGWHAPLSAVAQRAGVGQGSLYRHFPDRVSLALAVVDDNLVELERLGADPEAGLDDILDLIARQAIDSPALAEFLRSSSDDERIDYVGRRILELVDRALADGVRSGRLPAWITSADVMVAVDMIGASVGGPHLGTREETAERALRLIRSALRP